MKESLNKSWDEFLIDAYFIMESTHGHIYL
jgi:hypothetical protein